MTKGRMSEGICKKLQIGESALAKKSVAPDADSMLTPTIRAQRVGSSFIALIAPSFAPLKNDEKKSRFPNSIISATTSNTQGIMKADAFSIVAIDFTKYQ